MKLEDVVDAVADKYCAGGEDHPIGLLDAGICRLTKHDEAKKAIEEIILRGKKDPLRAFRPEVDKKDLAEVFRNFRDDPTPSLSKDFAAAVEKAKDI